MAILYMIWKNIIFIRDTTNEINKLTNNTGPNFDKSFLVLYPYSANKPKSMAVMINIDKSDVSLYIINILAKVIPVVKQYII